MLDAQDSGRTSDTNLPLHTAAPSCSLRMLTAQISQRSFSRNSIKGVNCRIISVGSFFSLPCKVLRVFQVNFIHSVSVLSYNPGPGLFLYWETRLLSVSIYQSAPSYSKTLNLGGKPWNKAEQSPHVNANNKYSGSKIMNPFGVPLCRESALMYLESFHFSSRKTLHNLETNNILYN